MGTPRELRGDLYGVPDRLSRVNRVDGFFQKINQRVDHGCCAVVSLQNDWIYI